MINSEQPLFSIVIPACDVAPYIGKLADSLKKQTFRNFEALIVNEESKDGTEEEIARCFADDPRFIPVKLPRSGSASESRNYGIRHARGKYLCFVDGDDWIEYDSLQVFAGMLEKYGDADLLIAAGTMFAELPDGTLEKKEDLAQPLPEGWKGSGVDAFQIVLRYYFRTATWLNLYRREFLLENNLFQVRGRRHQDDEWTPRVFFSAKQVLSAPYPYYNYRKRKNSVTTRPNPGSVTDYTDNILSFFQFWYTHEIPRKLKKPLAKWYCDFFFRYLSFEYRRCYAADLRFHELSRILKSRPDFRRYLGIVRYASPSKQALAPILYLARFRKTFPLAELAYCYFYHPVFMVLWKYLKRKTNISEHL